MKKILGMVFFCLVAGSGFSQTLSAKDQESVVRGKIVYEQNCLACHQADGSGVPFLNPPLAKTQWVRGEKSVLINIILKGLDMAIEVNGETFNNVMPAQAHLSDQEIADVLTYVRNSFGNQNPPVYVSEVGQVRRSNIQAEK